MRNRILVGTLIVFAATAAASVYALRRSQTASPKPVTVLFMCPRGAAKSVLAAAYFERMAKERGLNVRVESAGTDPDPTVAPAVAAHLSREGYPAPMSNPRKATEKDVESADVVISIGCDPSGLREPRGKLVRWDDVPPFTEDFRRADDAIRRRVTELIEELVRTSKK